MSGVLYAASSFPAPPAAFCSPPSCRHQLCLYTFLYPDCQLTVAITCLTSTLLLWLTGASGIAIGTGAENESTQALFPKELMLNYEEKRDILSCGPLLIFRRLLFF